MSFWKNFGFYTASAIDTILDSQDFTLEQLLDEDDILQETKAQNKKLIDCLSEPESLKKLLSYIAAEPAPDADQKRKFKYPFLAAEILASEIWQLIDAFYEQKGLLDELYSFLEKEPPLNPMLASYSSRVAGVFLQKKIPETIEYLKQKKDVISSFIKHLGNASVMDLLLKMIACEDISEETKILEWLCKTDLIDSLVSKFDPSNDEEAIENASQALVDIIAVSIRSPNSPLIAQLESEPMISKLFDFILSKGLSPSLLHGLTVLVELLQRHVQEVLDFTSTFDNLPSFLQQVLQKYDKLYEFLKLENNNNSNQKLNLTFGEIIPLGFHRLKIVEFFCSLVRTNYKFIIETLIKNGVITSCLELFFYYPWNNFLHATVSSMIEGILTSGNEDLEALLISETKLLEQIGAAAKENEEAVKKPKGVRRGNMGHITLISMLLLEKASSNQKVGKLLQDSKAWQEYTAEGGSLADIRKKESSTLGITTPFFDEEEQEQEQEQEDRFQTPEEEEEEEEEDNTVVKSDDTVVKPDDTFVKSDDTLVKSDDTLVKPEDTFVKSDDTPKESVDNSSNNDNKDNADGSPKEGGEENN